MEWFLRFDPVLGPREPEFVGPFPDSYSASQHQREHAPHLILMFTNPGEQVPGPVMSPTDHLAYLKERA